MILLRTGHVHKYQTLVHIEKIQKLISADNFVITVIYELYTLFLD